MDVVRASFFARIPESYGGVYLETHHERNNIAEPCDKANNQL